MPSASTFLVIFFVIVFITGTALGALVLFTISIHRTRRASLFKVSGEQHGATSRRLLIATRTDGKEGGE